MRKDDDTGAALEDNPSETGEPNARRSEPERRASVPRARIRGNPYVVLSAILVALLVVSAAWVMSGTTRPEVVIVAILPLSGASSYLVEMGDAMNLTVEEMNKWGGLNGMHINLVVVDCASSPEIAYEKLVEAEERYHPLAVVTATRAAAVPMAEFAEENGIVMISIGASPENVTEDRNWVFRYYITASSEVNAAMSTIGALDVNTLGILYLNDSYGTPVMTELKERHEASGGFAESVAFLPETEDFHSQVGEVIDDDAVFVIALRHQFPGILSELNSSGYSGNVLCAVEASIPTMWENPDAQGIYVNAPILYSPTATVDLAFLSEFEERFGAALTHQGAIASDVLELIWGLLSDSEVSRENLRHMLDSGFVSSGIMGVVVLDPGHRNVDIVLQPALVEGGGLEYL